MCFTGKTVRIHIKNKRAYWDNYVGYILDGVQGKALLPEDGETVIELKAQQRPGVESHELMIFKRQDACHEMAFLGVELDEGEGLLELPETSKPFFRKIEVYGDSVSAGEVSEAVDFVGKPDPEHDGQYSNSWYSYAWMTARKLNAQIHDIAQGGIALLDHTGWFCEPGAMGMEINT